MIHNSTKSVFAFMAFFLSFGCASQKNFSAKDFNAATISKGMLESDVITLIGEPSNFSRQSRINNQVATVSIYKYQSPTKDGKYLFKELTIIYVDKAVRDLNFRERISIEPVKGARVSNKILDISGAKFDL